MTFWKNKCCNLRIGSMLQGNEGGGKDLQIFKSGTLRLWQRHENKEKMAFCCGLKYDQFSYGEKENRDIEVMGRKDKDQKWRK